MITKVLVVLALLATSALAFQRRYDGYWSYYYNITTYVTFCIDVIYLRYLFWGWSYQVFQVKAQDETSFNALVKLYKEQSNIYDFWTEPRSLDRTIDIMAPPGYTKEFIHLLQTNNVDYRVKIADVQRWQRRISILFTVRQVLNLKFDLGL